jgi:transcriptional regulator with XRE-family HTH domain
MEALEAQREALVGKRQQVDAELHALDAEQQRALREQQREQATAQQQALIARLREAREQQGKTQAQVAKSLEISAAALGQRERGDKPPGQRALLEWAACLGRKVVLVDEAGQRTELPAEPEDLAGMLRARREEQGTSVAELAAKQGIEATQQSQREQRGAVERGYTLATMLTWAQVLGLRLELIASDE